MNEPMGNGGDGNFKEESERNSRNTYSGRTEKGSQGSSIKLPQPRTEPASLKGGQ